VPVDFSREHAFENLGEADLDRNKKTLLLWEGVILYLSEADGGVPNLANPWNHV
jgi:O-methyltransferase involved in polyketide biosynthesis